MIKRALTVLALVAALGCGGCDDRPTASPKPTPTPTSAPAPTAHVRSAADEDAATARWLRRRVTSAAAQWPAPPGSRRAAPSDLGWLHKQRQEAVEGIPLLTRSRLWLVPGDAKQVLARVVRHPAPGWGTTPRFYVRNSLGVDSGYGAPPGIVVHHRYVAGGRDRSRPFGQARGFLTASVQTLQLGDRVAVRVDVTGTPIPARPALSFVRHVTSIDFRQFRSFANHHLVASRHITDPTRMRTITGFLDRAQGWTNASHSCPYSFWPHYVLVLHTGTGDLRADSTNSCLGIWELRRDGQHQNPDVVADYRFNQLIRRLGVITRGM